MPTSRFPLACETTESTFLSIALHGTAHHVETIVRQYRRATEAAELSRERHQIVVHVDHARLRQHAAGRCELDDGPAIPAESARRLACDSSIVTIVEDDDGDPMARRAHESRVGDGRADAALGTFPRERSRRDRTHGSLSQRSRFRTGRQVRRPSRAGMLGV